MFVRIPCCNLSKIQMSTVLRWLLRAFILCQESPLLFQKVFSIFLTLYSMEVCLSVDCGDIFCQRFFTSRQFCFLFPFMVQVSRLLSSICLLTTLDGSISLPLQTENSISLNHWAAYFHQVSVGTYLHCQYYSRDKACSSKTPEVCW